MNTFVFSLVAKLTVLLILAGALDWLFHRKRLLSVTAMWNAVTLAIFALPIAMFCAPNWSVRVLPTEAAQADVSQPAVAKERIQHQERPLDIEGADRPGTSIAGNGPADSRSDVSSAQPVAAIGSPTAWSSMFVSIAVIYFAGAALLLGRLIANWRAAWRLTDCATPVASERWVSRFEHWREQIHGNRRPKIVLLESAEISAPLALGQFNRRIIIPAQLAASTSTETIDAILVHELAHLARSDFAWLILDRIVVSLYWFHPLCWLAARRIAFLRERACDEFAVHILGSTERYSTTLVDLAASMQGTRGLSLGLAVVRASKLERRLEALEQSAGSSRFNAPRTIRWSAAMVGLCATFVISGIALDHAIAQEPAQKPVEKEAKPVENLTVAEALRRMQESIDKIRSYDVLVDVNYQWPLKTVVVPVNDPARPAIRERLEWSKLDPGETPPTDTHLSHQQAAGGNRRTERQGKFGYVAVQNETSLKFLHDAPPGGQQEASISKPGRGMIEEGEDYEEFFKRLWMGWTLTQLIDDRPAESVTIAADRGLLRIDLPAGVAKILKDFGWRVWLDPEHGYLPKKIEVSRKDRGNELALDRTIEILRFKQIGEGAWAPVEILMKAYNSQAGALLGEVALVNRITVDEARSQWNIDLPDDRFVLAFPAGVQVIDETTNRRFVATEGDTGKDDARLEKTSKDNIQMGKPEIAKPVDLTRVPENERNAVKDLQEKWHAIIELASDGTIKRVSFPIEMKIARIRGRGPSFYDDGMPLIGQLKHLKVLGLEDTQITDKGLESVKDLTELERLSLENTDVTDAGLRNLHDLKRLKRLYLDNNTYQDDKVIKCVQVTDAGLAHLKGLESLEFIDLRGTDITDAGLEHLKGLSKLNQLSLNTTKVTAEGVKKLQAALPELKYVGFDK